MAAATATQTTVANVPTVQLDAPEALECKATEILEASEGSLQSCTSLGVNGTQFMGTTITLDDASVIDV
jgi:hypothetical protein